MDISVKEKNGCFGKEKHKSRLAAEWYLDNWNEVRSKKMSKRTAILEIYECEFCGAWHIGHNLQKANKQGIAYKK